MNSVPHYERDRLAIGEIYDALVTGTRPIYFQENQAKPIGESGSLFIAQWKQKQFAITVKHVFANCRYHLSPPPRKGSHHRPWRVVAGWVFKHTESDWHEFAHGRAQRAHCAFATGPQSFVLPAHHGIMWYGNGRAPIEFGAQARRAGLTQTGRPVDGTARAVGDRHKACQRRALAGARKIATSQHRQAFGRQHFPDTGNGLKQRAVAFKALMAVNVIVYFFFQPLAIAFKRC